jgi:O-antigen/teichoic acid export membrane protein
MPDGKAIHGDAAAPATRTTLRPSLYRNVLSNWTSTLLAIVYALVITPIVVRTLNDQLYGIWAFLNGLVAYSNLFYMGLGSALVRYVAEYHTKRDRAALNRLASVVLSLYTTVGLLALAAMAAVAPYVPSIMTGTLAPGTAAAAKATAILLGARLFLMFVASVFSGVVVAEGRYDLFNLVAISGTLVRFACVPLVVRGPNPLLGLATVVVATGAAETLAHAAMARYVDPGLRVRLARPRPSELRLLFGFGFFAFLLQVGDRIISYTDTTVIGVMLGASSVTLYVLPLQLAEYARIAVNGMASVLLPHLMSLKTLGQEAEVGAEYLRSVRTASFVAAFLNVNLLFLGTSFLRRWVGPSFAGSATPVLACLTAAGFLQSIATQTQWPFCMTLRLVRFPVAVLLVEALANLLLSIVLARPLGIVGVAIGTAVPALLCTTLFVPRYVSRHLGLPFSRVIREAVLPSFALIGALSAVLWPMNLAFPSSSYLSIVGKGLMTVPAAAAVAFVVFPRSERDAVLATIRTISTRKRKNPVETSDVR